jgi:type II secretory pathway pseudopilin PulG
MASESASSRYYNDMDGRIRKERSSPGTTLIELIVVVAIITLLAAAIMGGFSRFLKTNKTNSGLATISSTLHYARALAIANNRVYHVRFESMDTDPNSPSFNKPIQKHVTQIHVTDPDTGVSQWLQDPSPKQYISIYCFPNVADALSITEDSTTTPILWNPLGHNVGTPPKYNNVLVGRYALPDETFFGIQYLGPAPPQADRRKLLYFQNNGSASSSMTFFVTTNPQFADDQALDDTSYAQLQSDRREFYNQGTLKYATPKVNSVNATADIKMIQVYTGGMIKELQTMSGTNTKL